MRGALQLLRVMPEVLFRQPQENVARILGIVQYGLGATDMGLRQLGIPLAKIPVLPLNAPDGICEIWQSSLPTQEGRTEDVHWRNNGMVAFLSWDQVDTEGSGLANVTEDAYHALFSAVHFQKHHLIRVWNHVGEINDDSAGLERYRQFNIGRQQAFVGTGRSLAGASVPAASALGASASALDVFALSAGLPAVAIENPRQTSAYHYPAEYGPRAPLFSRANLVDIGGGTLFVSGTASIVGHQTRHQGDCRAQTRETLRNIQVLLDETRMQYGKIWTLSDLELKVYVRFRSDLPAVVEEMERVIGGPVDALFLQADICRKDLLVEIEAVGLARTR
ncbi:hypothetical protein [Acidithiobacillus sp. AMEEHan]|uniref:chorismate transformation enzyme, FkbO/Hyg5 family n=1 Tax=Acidithiobacillus sp. AMEEHan TaxID=2994951 RepID=UPI0027E547CE|nr:hypothetical protein [Acidithiobacillus sp. AMEEHan]